MLMSTPATSDLHKVIERRDNPLATPHGVPTIEWSDCARQICDGLGYVHTMGVTMNDLKPGSQWLSLKHSRSIAVAYP